MIKSFLMAFVPLEMEGQDYSIMG